jgi:hypothetical protein
MAELHVELTKDERNQLVMALGLWLGAWIRSGRDVSSVIADHLELVNKLCRLDPPAPAMNAPTAVHQPPGGVK